MKVKLLISRAGAGFAQDAGEVIEVTAEEAKRLVEKGFAESVERATKKPRTEKAVK